MGEGSLRGNRQDFYFHSSPYFYNTLIEFNNLPSLQSFTAESSAMQCIGQVISNGMNKAANVNLGKNALVAVYFLESDSLSSQSFINCEEEEEDQLHPSSSQVLTATTSSLTNVSVSSSSSSSAAINTTMNKQMNECNSSLVETPPDPLVVAIQQNSLWWYYGNQQSNETITSLHVDIADTLTDLEIAPSSVNNIGFLELNLAVYPQLQHLLIRSKSFSMVSTFRCEHHPAIQCIDIRSHCFMHWKTNQEIYTSKFIVDDCPGLQSLSIGKYSFREYTDFTLQQVPALQTLRIGSSSSTSTSFLYVSKVVLQNMLSLTSIVLGSFVFVYCEEVVIKNMPVLEEIILNDGSMLGKQASIVNDCYSGKLVMEDCPVLKTLDCRYGNNLSFFGQCTIVNLPELTKIEIGKNSLRNIVKLETTSEY